MQIMVVIMNGASGAGRSGSHTPLEKKTEISSPDSFESAGERPSQQTVKTVQVKDLQTPCEIAFQSVSLSEKQVGKISARERDTSLIPFESTGQKSDRQLFDLLVKRIPPAELMGSVNSWLVSSISRSLTLEGCRREKEHMTPAEYQILCCTAARTLILQLCKEREAKILLEEAFASGSPEPVLAELYLLLAEFSIWARHTPIEFSGAITRAEGTSILYKNVISYLEEAARLGDPRAWWRLGVINFGSELFDPYVADPTNGLHYLSEAITCYQSKSEVEQQLYGCCSNDHLGSVLFGNAALDYLSFTMYPGTSPRAVKFQICIRTILEGSTRDAEFEKELERTHPHLKTFLTLIEVFNQHSQREAAISGFQAWSRRHLKNRIRGEESNVADLCVIQVLLSDILSMGSSDSDLDSALDYAERVIRERPKNYHMHERVFRLGLRLGKYDKAENACNALVRIYRETFVDPDKREYFQSMAEYVANKKREDKKLPRGLQKVTAADSHRRKRRAGAGTRKRIQAQRGLNSHERAISFPSPRGDGKDISMVKKQSNKRKMVPPHDGQSLFHSTEPTVKTQETEQHPPETPGAEQRCASEPVRFSYLNTARTLPEKGLSRSIVEGLYEELEYVETLEYENAEKHLSDLVAVCKGKAGEELIYEKRAWCHMKHYWQTTSFRLCDNDRELLESAEDDALKGLSIQLGVSKKELEGKRREALSEVIESYLSEKIEERPGAEGQSRIKVARISKGLSCAVGTLEHAYSHLKGYAYGAKWKSLSTAQHSLYNLSHRLRHIAEAAM